MRALEEAGDLGNLGIRLWVNDELMQDSSSSNLIFTMAEQVAHLSTRLTLMPGDVIATGTPAGCGAARTRPSVVHADGTGLRAAAAGLR